MKLLVFAAVVSVTMGLFTNTANAQETQLVVAPAIIDAPAFIGESTTRKLQVTNTNEFALPISIAVQSAIIDGEPLEEGQNERYDVSDWIRFDEDTYLFEAGQTREIEFSITPPFTAMAGGHYAQISLRGLALEGSLDGQQGLVFPEIGVPVLITVPGEIIEDARFSNTSIFPRFTRSNEQIDVEVPVENLGTVHNLVSLQLVLQKDGQTIREDQLSPGVILPSTRKVFRGSWTAPDYGQYSAFAEVTYGGDQITVRSEVELVTVTPSPLAIITVGLVVWSTCYIWPRRANVKASLRALFMDE